MASDFSKVSSYVERVRQELPSGSVHGFFGNDTGQNPALGDTIAYGLNSCRTVWLMGHGMAGLDGSGDTVLTGHPLMFNTLNNETAVQEFLNRMCPTAREYLEIVPTFSSPDWTLYGIQLSQAGMIALGDRNPSFNSRLVIGMYCGSTSDAARTDLGFDGVPENAGCSDAVLVGYSGVATNLLVDADIPTLIDGMTCWLWDQSVNAPLAEALGYGRTHLGEISAKLEAYGCTGNQMLPCWKDCQSWASGLSAHASADSVHVLVQNEESSDAFVVRGFAYPDAPPETLATFAGNGACGVGMTRSHVLPVWTNSLIGGDVIVRDESGRSLWSAVFASGDSTESAPMLRDGECVRTYADSENLAAPADTVYELRGDHFVPRSLNPPDSMMEPPHDADCADVLVYGTVSNPYWYSTVGRQVTGYSQGTRSLKAVSYSSGGNTSPATAHAQYMLLRSRNIAYNNTWGELEGKQYPVTPMLILLGDPGVAHYSDTDCEGCVACGASGCRSYALITDVDGDGIQDGPVSLIPCRSDEEVAKACQMADEWNAGEWRDPGRGVAVFAGDVVAGNQDVPAFRNEAEGLYARLCSSINAPRGFLAHSDLFYPWAYFEGEAAEVILDTGVSELWTFGLATGASGLPFIHPLGSSRKQRVVIIAPTCQSAELDDNTSPNDIQMYMFRPADETVAAGGIGVETNGYGPQHSALIEALADEMMVVPAGRTYAQIALDAARTVAARYPGYASTVTTFGAYLLCPAGPSPAGVEGAEMKGPEALRASTVREGERLWLGVSSPFAGSSRIEVFDTVGRLVAGADVAGLKVGWNARVLDLARVSRGVYFVTLRAGGDGGRNANRAKFVIVE
jgi:hypothetical protein